MQKQTGLYPSDSNTSDIDIALHQPAIVGGTESGEMHGVQSWRFYFSAQRTNAAARAVWRGLKWAGCAEQQIGLTIGELLRSADKIEVRLHKRGRAWRQLAHNRRSAMSDPLPRRYR
jgi:hypothetical protein